MESEVRETPPRGVYKANWKIDGCEALYAVNSRGERLRKIVVLRPGVSEPRAVRWLEQLLERLDPRPPSLRLVLASPGPRHIPLERLDALYRDANPVDALFWQRKRERMRGTSRPASQPALRLRRFS